MKPILEVSHLSKKYGSFTAVNDISFQLQRNRCIALLGTNGAGKTTTMKMIYAAASITRGRITVDGFDVKKAPSNTKRALGIVSQEDLLDGSLTVYENMIAHGLCYDIPKRELKKRTQNLLTFAGLANYDDKQISDLSGGMRRRLVLARALLNHPKVIILDEPTTGLDIQSRHVIWKKLDQLKSEGVSLLLTSHYMDEVQRLADQVLIIHRGKILASGAPDTLPAKYGYQSLEEAFLALTDFHEEDDHIVQALS
ncbi:ABC transporter ATP-binding protein [Furfurilactobacillus rossiae]|uniref:ABC transporter ATP-binding protein n=1 Tax=Furfurilactobacillus rossiae TaxID=231049 RepID=UPI0015BFFFFD|nr:ABC transporter ATP-binding protein [Furfurilactobacillus rossiae]MCF6166229.1 ABC transporter ATP-binding protein [Furfurilactobacillus rossiae]QLE65251.1 ABC transporter ATP-binding protein [Furfurilactobacillus rossiae]